MCSCSCQCATPSTSWPPRGPRSARSGVKIEGLVIGVAALCRGEENPLGECLTTGEHRNAQNKLVLQSVDARQWHSVDASVAVTEIEVAWRDVFECLALSTDSIAGSPGAHTHTHTQNSSPFKTRELWRATHLRATTRETRDDARDAQDIATPLSADTQALRVFGDSDDASDSSSEDFEDEARVCVANCRWRLEVHARGTPLSRDGRCAAFATFLGAERLVAVFRLRVADQTRTFSCAFEAGCTRHDSASQLAGIRLSHST